MDFEQFKQKYPHATYTDWWNTCAHFNSGGELPNPLESPDFAAREELHKAEKKREFEAEKAEKIRQYQNGWRLF